MNKERTLLERLEEYGKTNYYPFHMPGHKRQEESGITSFPNPFSVDITEIDGFDNLHRPEGILKEAMENAASLYGSEKTYYLVNGSTCGILSALSAAVHSGGRLLLARNSHKAAYHAALLNDMDVEYLYPDCIDSYGIQGGIAPELVEKALSCHGGTEAVFITSPTYEGIVSDIPAIAHIAHKHGIPLIVDEAHGAHFSFGDGELFPASALSCGADVVIQSLHKTLPSLTQTAILHVRSDFISIRRLEQYLQIFQSSSPSYVLMSSIDSCVRYMGAEGRTRLSLFGNRLKSFIKECESELCFLKLLNDDEIARCHGAARDISKILVSTKNTPLTGARLAEILREQYHLEAEMSCCNYVLLMTSLMDQEEGLNRLKEGLLKIDTKLGREIKADRKRALIAGKTDVRTWLENPVRRTSIAEAMNLQPIHIKAEEAAGRMSCGFITVYPPGVPAVVPGEVITQEAIELIRYHGNEGLAVEGVSSDGTLSVAAENKNVENA